ncbi:MAG: T9SS type A sorting domain-containing protein [Bacteroidetes bacterium]|nr:T9SS type A sorting domain-containing protein [Bacteroidota bacterium]
MNSLDTQIPKGIYVVSVMVGEQTINKKLIVQ